MSKVVDKALELINIYEAVNTNNIMAGGRVALGYARAYLISNAIEELKNELRDAGYNVKGKRLHYYTIKEKL